jgi:hypothetical protein
MERTLQTKINKQDIKIPTQVLKDITRALLNYFNETLHISVIENDQKVDVRT